MLPHPLLCSSSSIVIPFIHLQCCTKWQATCCKKPSTCHPRQRSHFPLARLHAVFYLILHCGLPLKKQLAFLFLLRLTASSIIPSLPSHICCKATFESDSQAANHPLRVHRQCQATVSKEHPRSEPLYAKAIPTALYSALLGSRTFHANIRCSVCSTTSWPTQPARLVSRTVCSTPLRFSFKDVSYMSQVGSVYAHDVFLT